MVIFRRQHSVAPNPTGLHYGSPRILPRASSDVPICHRHFNSQWALWLKGLRCQGELAPDLGAPSLSLGPAEHWDLTKCCVSVFGVGGARCGNFSTLAETSWPGPRSQEAVTKMGGPETFMKFISHPLDICHFLLIGSNQHAILMTMDHDGILWNGEAI